MSQKNLIAVAVVRFARGTAVCCVWDKPRSPDLDPNTGSPGVQPDIGWAAFPGSSRLRRVVRLGWGLWREAP